MKVTVTKADTMNWWTPEGMRPPTEAEVATVEADLVASATQAWAQRSHGVTRIKHSTGGITATIEDP